MNSKISIILVAAIVASFAAAAEEPEAAPTAPPAWRNADEAHGRGAYAVAVLGDMHFDAAPESVYHAKYNNANPHAKVQHEEFHRNGEMWAPGGRCQSLVAASAALAATNKDTRFVLQLGDLIQGDCNDDGVHRRMLDDGLAAVRGPYPADLPFLTVMGNHDFRGSPKGRTTYFGWAQALLSKEVGKPVSYPLFSFRVDDDRWIFCDFERVDLRAVAREIEADKDARYVFLVTHGPFTASDGKSWRWRLSGWTAKGGNGQGAKQLFDAVCRRRAIVLSGHTHATTFYRNENPLGGYTEFTANSVWKADELATIKPAAESPAKYGTRNRDKVPEEQRDAFDAEIARFKDGLKEYFISRAAGHFRLEVSDDRVLMRLYPSAAMEPARTFDLTP